jgi:hypothetical protein
MSSGVRVFFIDNNDQLHRIPQARFDRLVLRGDSSERFPEFAGQRVRYALVFVELESRVPVAIKYVDYSILPLDEEGKMDSTEEARVRRLGVDMLSSYLSETKDKSVIDASHRFYKKQHDHEFRWQPSQEVERAIAQAIFSKKRKPLKLV